MTERADPETSLQSLQPAERLGLTTAKAQLARGENLPINITAVLVMALERLVSKG